MNLPLLCRQHEIAKGNVNEGKVEAQMRRKRHLFDYESRDEIQTPEKHVIISLIYLDQFVSNYQFSQFSQ